MSAYEKTAKEHVVLSGLESYIEDTIEYSDTIISIHNDIENVKQKSEADFEEATSYINRVRDLINRDVEREIYSLQNEVTDLETRITDIIEDSLQTRIDELKDYFEDLIKQELEK